MLMALGLATAAAAQPVADPVPTIPVQAVALEPVVVTSRLRTEGEQQVPASVVVVSGEALAEEGRSTIGDLDSRVANLQLGDLNGTPTVFLRGVGGGGRQVAFEPRTGIYIDGVFMNTPPLADALLLDLDRVEVPRGPQGSLFGQNTVSGAISLVTRAPGAQFAVQGLSRVDDRGERRLAAAMDLPLIDETLLLRLSGHLGQADGVIRNAVDGRKPDASKDAGTRARLQWRVAPGLTADFSADTSFHTDDMPTGEARSSPDGRGADAHPAPYTVALDAPQRDQLRSSGVAGTLRWDNPWGTLTSISSWRQARRNWLIDVDYSPADGTIADYADRYQRWSQELRLTSAVSDTQRLSWLGGVYVYRQIADSVRDFAAGDDIDAFIPPLAPGDVLTGLPRLDTRSFAAFGSLGYRLRADLRLDAGLRLVTLHRRLDETQIASSGFNTLGFVSFGPLQRRSHEAAALPDVALSWDLSPSLTSYARYARGSKSGGYDADPLSANRTLPPEFEDETVDSYELGLKTQWLQQRLRANLALFLAEYEDYQVSQFRPSGNGTLTVPVVSNAGRVRTFGPELELLARPLRGLTLRSSAAWLQAEYAEFVDGGGAGVDFSGNRTEFAPRWTVNSSAEYRQPVPWGPVAQLETALSYSWRSGFYTQPSNLPPFRADSRSLLGLRVGVQDRSGRYHLSLYGDNLLDDRYSETLNRGTLGTLYGRFGPPRSFGVQLQVQTD